MTHWTVLALICIVASTVVCLVIAQLIYDDNDEPTFD